MLNFNAHFIPLLTALEVKGYPHTVEVSNDGLCIRFQGTARYCRWHRGSPECRRGGLPLRGGIS